MTQILVSKALAARMRRVGEDVIRERMALGTVDIHLGAVGFLPEAVLTMSEFQDHLAGLYNLRRKIRDNATEIAMDAIATAYADGQAAGLKTVQYRKALRLQLLAVILNCAQRMALSNQGVASC